jgi:hypothetical protein
MVISVLLALILVGMYQWYDIVVFAKTKYIPATTPTFEEEIAKRA